MAVNLNIKNMQVLRDYIIKEKLGVGSYGVVYKVLKKGDKQYYVLKQISLFNMNKAQVEEVKNESKILSSLNSSYIVKYCDSFIESNNLNIIMEYCDRGDLSNFLNIQMKSGKLMTEDKIWNFFIQISLGLACIHNKKILHRDLKTLNIFLSKDDKVKIGDLGVAKILNQTNFARTFVGTPYYLSPEICEEKPYNEKSDVWALGCILYEMITFKHPFNATNQGALILKILKGKYDPISSKDYSSDLKRMVDLLLDKNHFKRPNVSDIIKNPIFLNRAKNLNIMETVIQTTSELNIIIENLSLYKEVSASKELQDNKRVYTAPSSEKNANKKSNGDMSNVIKNVKIEFNKESEKKPSIIEDPSKRFIQMNLPQNYRKQLIVKKEKKDLISKQNNIVKQVINQGSNPSSGNPFSNVNNLILEKKDKKIPVKLIRKEAPIKKESGSNFNVNNVNINGNNIISKEKESQRNKEVNQKINEFDLKLNVDNRKISTPSENIKIKENLVLSKPKRPLTSSNASIKEKKIATKSQEKEECVIDDIKFNTKLLENPDIKIVEKAPMILPKKPSRDQTPPLKSTHKFINDDKGCTIFFKDLMKSNYDNLFPNGDMKASNYIDINHFVNDLNKKSNCFDDFSSKASKIYDQKVSISEFLNPPKRDSEGINKLTKETNTIPDKKKSNKEDLIDTVPLYNNYNYKESNLNFQVCYENEDNVVNNSYHNNPIYNSNKNCKSAQNYSYVKSTENNSEAVLNSQNKCLTEDSYDQENNTANDEENEEDHSNDDEEEEAVEDVSVIRELKPTVETYLTVEIEKEKEKDPQQEIKELIELKEKFSKKINFYKEESKKSSGDKDFNKIFEYYKNISENQEDDELCNKIDSYIRNLIPENYFNFIQHFYNLIYYEVQLGNVEKELESRKLNY